MSLPDTTIELRPGAPVSPNGHVPDTWEHRSRLLAYLPAIYAEGDEASFLARYLLIFQSFFDDFDSLLDQLPAYFSAHTAPEAFLPWLASWIGLLLDDTWPLDRRRAVLANAMLLHHRRGTLRGLTEHIELYTGIRPEIVEGGTGLTLGRTSRLGQQTVLGKGNRPHHFSVILRVPDPDAVDRGRLRRVIEAQRPAHTTCALFVLPRDDSVASGAINPDGSPLVEGARL